MQNPDEWRTPAYRENMIQRIDEILHQFQGPMNRTATEMENHVFMKAKSKEEYVAYTSKIMMFLRNSGKRAGATVQEVSIVIPVQEGMQDRIRALRPLALQGTSKNNNMSMQGPGRNQPNINQQIGSSGNLASSLHQSLDKMAPGQINVQQALQNNTRGMNIPHKETLDSGADQFQKNDQAIVIDAMTDLKINDYVQAVGKLIGPKNITFASKIPKGKVCLYLRTKELADRIAAASSSIQIGSHSLAVRLLVPKAKQIIISNVCPAIPHSEIEKKLLEHGVQLKSPMKFLSAGIDEPGYAHVMSFQRQVDVHPDAINQLPETLQINYNGTVDWIYFSSEKVTCSSCGEEGHLARNCKSIDSSTADSQAETPLAEHSLPSVVESSSSSASNLTKESPSKSTTENVSPSRSGVKRSFSTYSGASDSDILQNRKSKQITPADPPSLKLVALEQNEKPVTDHELDAAKDHSI